ncbi:MAG TPA: hypothetical protein VJ938_04205 [Acidimicrobiia bacterium]|nr:hypothetical protein [Acidimicrobiia bacterium]
MAIDLPGMQLLGFDDEVDSVYVEHRAFTERSAVATQSRPVQDQVRSVVSNAVSRVQDLWETTEISSDTLEKWVPGVIARRKLRPNAYRAGTWVWLGAGVFAVMLLFWLFVARPNAAAAEANANLSNGAREVAGSIAAVQEVAASLAAPRPPDLVGSTQTALQAESGARALFTAAGALDESDDTAVGRRDLAVEGAGAVLEATSRINRLLAYRLSAEQALVPPDLPADPAAVDISTLSGQVAAWRAAVSETVEALPDDVLPEDTARLAGWEADLQQWQETYLDALREGKLKQAGAAVTDQTERIQGLRTQLLADAAIEAKAIDTLLDTAAGSLRALLAG